MQNVMEKYQRTPCLRELQLMNDFAIPIRSKSAQRSLLQCKSMTLFSLSSVIVLRRYVLIRLSTENDLYTVAVVIGIAKYKQISL